MSTTEEKVPEHTADVSSQRVARIYAEALVNAAEKRGVADAVVEELESLVQDLFPTQPHFESFLSSSAIGRDHKAAVLEKIFAGRASATFSDFLQVLNKHERLELVRPILSAAQELRNQRARRIRVQVRSAIALPDDQRAHLVQILQESLHLEPILEIQVDPALLGGLIVRVGDWLYDGSVRTKLDFIRKQLIERSSHEIQSRRDRFCTANGN